MNINKILEFFAVGDFLELAIRAGICALVYIVFHRLSIWLVKFLPGIFSKFFKNGSEKSKEAFVNIFAKPLSFFVKSVGIFLAVTNFPLNAAASVFVYGVAAKVMRIIIILMISSAAQSFVINITELFDAVDEKHGGLNRTLIVFITKIGKALVIVFTIMIVIEEFGYDVTGLITGLGLGGLTFALAAQDIASNLMSGMAILVDKPFRVGDWIKVAGYEGIVEEMNFRSCRIRTFDNALITIPNSKISGDSIANWTKMNYRKTNIIIGLVYSTSRDTMQKVCDEIYTALSAMEEIKTDSLQVKFDNFSRSSMDIKISYNSYPIPGKEHLALKEKVNYTIMDIVAQNDTDFAYNTVAVVKG